MKNPPVATITTAPMTGLGIETKIAVTFGDTASRASPAPTTYPTRRAATAVEVMSVALKEEYTVVGGVPTAPANRMPSPLVLSEPCTSRKSVTLGFRCEACWTVTLSAMFLTPPTRVMIAKAGSSVQKSSPKPKSTPGRLPPGQPIHAASITGPGS